MEEDRNDHSPSQMARREKLNAFVRPGVKMRKAQGREEVAHDQV